MGGRGVYKQFRRFAVSIMMVLIFSSRIQGRHFDVHENAAALSLPSKQEQHQLDQIRMDYLHLEQFPHSVNRRRLALGSSPPQCNGKCGRCLPCRPVHVPIQPGLVKTAEYYPEAWRCKCGNKLFMP